MHSQYIANYLCNVMIDYACALRLGLTFALVNKSCFSFDNFFVLNNVRLPLSEYI
jgi:hypothetical protein